MGEFNPTAVAVLEYEMLSHQVNRYGEQHKPTSVSKTLVGRNQKLVNGGTVNEAFGVEGLMPVQAEPGSPFRRRTFSDVVNELVH